MDLFTERYSQMLEKSGILPVVCLKNHSELQTFVQAILKTSIRCVELTMRHPFTTEAIGFIKKNYPEFVVGAGTVNTVEKLKEAIDCGADFCVSPGTVDEILIKAYEYKMPFLVGGSTPSEIMKLDSMGYKTIKFFPAEGFGGAEVLKHYEGAFAGIKFLPTGGINEKNLAGYLSRKNVLCCGGSFMLKGLKLEGGNADEIANAINDFIKIYEQVRVK